MAQGQGREVRSFDYVNHPFESVRDALTKDTLAVFRSATRAAASRTESVASALHVEIAGIEVGKEIDIAVRDIEDDTGPRQTPLTRFGIEWKASKAPGLFPLMQGELAVYPLTATETQLDFSGNYEPPMGWLGTAVDTMIGHRIAEASVDRFVKEVAEYLRTTLAKPK